MGHTRETDTATPVLAPKMASLDTAEGLSITDQSPVEIINTPDLDGNMPISTHAMASLTTGNASQGVAEGIDESITPVESTRSMPCDEKTEASANPLDASDMQVAGLQAHVVPVSSEQTTPIPDTTNAPAAMSHCVSPSETMSVVTPEAQGSSSDTFWGDETTSWGNETVMGWGKAALSIDTSRDGTDDSEHSLLAAYDACPTDTADPSTIVKRKLVTVRRIKKIVDAGIGNKVVIHIDGWTVVESRCPFLEVREWQVGDLVIFCEIDSFLPKTVYFLDLFTNPRRITTFNGKQGYRVLSTVKGKHLSQGLIFPLSNFWTIYGPYLERVKQAGHAAATAELLSKSFEGLLGVVKWELADEAATAGIIGTTPGFVVNPSWFRAQNIEDDIFAAAWRNKVWQVTEKLDGVSMHVYKVAAGTKWFGCLPVLPPGQEYPATMRDPAGRGHVGVCSRTQDFLDRAGNLYWEAANGGGDVARKIWEIPYPNISVQGELCGSSIMGNTMELPEGEHRFVVFGIWNFDTGAYLNVREVHDICKKLRIEHVPAVGYYKIREFAGNMDELLAKANGQGTGAFGGLSEGYVFRSLDGKSHFKVISNKWLAVTGK
ncbi:RNA ligase-domain-containing protein [Podospora aff. communis PSN243]|uniref:RNA ligase-domain-containing protein n=1 Tax=Podospora aff. communis PSN243 TaxID=3040156 RepID=A0AAV9H4X9_9PEZI|nr:RNA ligase-domain-containing protein [Podospora aff. communis PSN243]